VKPLWGIGVKPQGPNERSVMYKRVKRFFIVPLLVIIILFSSCAASYYSPTMVQASGVESIALNWLLSVMAFLGQSYSNTDDAKKSLTGLRQYIDGQITDAVANSKTMIPITTNGTIFMMKLQYFIVCDFIFNKGDVSGAIQYSHDNTVFLDSFSMIVRIVKAYFSGVVNWVQDVVGTVNNVYSEVTDITKSSLDQYFTSMVTDPIFISIFGDQQVSRSNQILAIYNGLTLVQKKAINDALGDKYMMIYQASGSETFFDVYDLPENTISIYYSNQTSWGTSYNLPFYITSDNVVHSLFDELNNGPNSFMYEFYSRPENGDVGSYNKGTGPQYYTMNFSNTYTGDNFVGGVHNTIKMRWGGNTAVVFQGLQDVKKYSTVASYQVDNPTFIDPTSYISNDVTTSSSYDVVTIGAEQTLADTIPIDAITPLDASLVIPEVAAGDYANVNTQVDSAVNTANPADTSSLSNYRSFGLSAVFPFCIPFDVIAALKLFSANAVAPNFVWTFSFGGLFNPVSINLDLSQFDDTAALVRKLETVLFIVGLAVATRSKFIRG